MNSPQHQGRNGVDATAREWFVRLLDDDVAEEELVAWGLWLDADPAHRAAYARVAETWDALGAAQPPRAGSIDLARDGYRATEPVTAWRRAARERLSTVWRLAAMLVLGVGIALAASAYLLRQPVVERFATGRAERLQTRLADGSELDIGAKTDIQVVYERHRRAIGLDRGEVLFKVAHDRTRPFVVRTPLGAITAVGTAFNVDVGQDGVTLYVAEGVVSVDTAQFDPAGAPGSGLRVAAGQKLRIERDGGRFTLTQSTGATPPSWAEGRLEYRNEPLRSVIEDVNRYASRQIVIADPSVGELTYTGTVTLRSADAWALGLTQAFPVTAEFNEHRDLVLKEKSAKPIPLRGPHTS